MNLIKILNHIEKTPGSAFFYTPNLYEGNNYFFGKTDVELSAGTKEEIEETLNEVDVLRNSDKKGFGLIPYEIGYLFEERLLPLFEKGIMPMRFFFSESENVEIISTGDIDYGSVSDRLLNSDVEIYDFNLNVERDVFEKDIEKIKNYIKSGDTYQVNYTAEASFKFNGSPTDIFLKLIFNQSARYSCIINLGDKFILSISPELFFEIRGSSILVRPMKGTIKRGKDLTDDVRIMNRLKESTKDRAENIMIVDLLRNDIGRISEFDSVIPENIYEIEKYETVYQMVSTVKSKLTTNSFSEIISNIFPCGSITGAPKIRTMEIIRELEKRSRGIYTGAIGLIDKDFITFNVAIRTLEIDYSGEGKVGLGSGIVWESDPSSEYEETLSKGKFITEPTPYFEIIESMLLENGEIFLLKEHLKRMKETANYFLFRFDEKMILNELKKSIDSADTNQKYKIKILLNKWGYVNVSVMPVRKTEGIVKVILSEHSNDSSDKFYRFKTTNRPLYDSELSRWSEKGFTEVIFMNEKKEITEGAITNIFILKNNKWFTPRLECGLLNGVYRNYYIELFQAEEKRITLKDLINADKLLLTNSVRKEIIVDFFYTFNEQLLKDFSD